LKGLVPRTQVRGEDDDEEHEEKPRAQKENEKIGTKRRRAVPARVSAARRSVVDLALESSDEED
jgi:hypothetical protein